MKRDKLLIILFCVFIGVFTLMFLFTPKREVSVNEKRTLAEFPKLTARTVFDGSFESNFEEYMGDHFPFRENLIALDSYYALYTGRNGSNGVYKGKDGYLINTPVTANDKQLFENLDVIEAFADKTKLPVSVMVVPSSGYIMSDKLPKNHQEYKDGEILDTIKNELKNTNWIELSDAFKSEKDSHQLYYKTDHHWTTMGAYIAYEQFAKSHGFETVKDFDIQSYDGFYGTSYSKSALWGEKGETLEVWRYPNSVSVEIKEGVKSDTYSDMFFGEYLSDSDMYSVYLGGNHALTRLYNPESDGGKLLLLKDSYAHCIAPFLINHYSQIDMVDLRYYFESVSELANREQYNEALLLYGLSSVCENNDISILE